MSYGCLFHNPSLSFGFTRLCVAVVYVKKCWCASSCIFRALPYLVVKTLCHTPPCGEDLTQQACTTPSHKPYSNSNHFNISDEWRNAVHIPSTRWQIQTHQHIATGWDGGMTTSILWPLITMFFGNIQIFVFNAQVPNYAICRLSFRSVNHL